MQTGDVLVEWSHSPDADLVGYHLELLDDAGEVVGTVFTQQDSVTLSSEAVGSGVWLRIRPEDVLGEGDASEAIFLGSGGAIASTVKPNPASGTVQLDIFLPGSGPAVEAEVKIVDATGRLIYSVYDDLLTRGSHTLSWNGASTNGKAVPSGVYFYLVEADGLGYDSGRIMIVR
jgi:hypothetical protein